MTALTTKTYQHQGHTVLEHFLTVPLDHQILAKTQRATGSVPNGTKPALYSSLADLEAAIEGKLPNGSVEATASTNPTGNDNPIFANTTITVFAREIIPPNGEHLPRVVFLQGGPGGASPRQADFSTAWIGRALKEYRVVLLDQRGTGNSTVLDKTTAETYPNPADLAAYIGYFRADQIIGDCEALRVAINDNKPWSTIGQSYGGFLTLAYLSHAPQGLTECFITGGLPGIGTSLHDLYRCTYQLTKEHNDSYFAAYPEDEKTLREVCAHLNTVEETLPTGHRLTSERLRTVGIQLGMDSGRDAMHFFLEDPFTMINGKKRLNDRFLTEASHRLDRFTNPLFAVVHEPIYAGLLCPPDQCVNWVAHQVRQEPEQVAAGFAVDADPLDLSKPYPMTGEHIFPWEFEQDPALIPFREAQALLANQTDWPDLYDLDQLAANDVPVYAVVYLRDMFVPAVFSLETAKMIANCTVWENADDEHDAIRAKGPKILDHLFGMRTTNV